MRKFQGGWPRLIGLIPKSNVATTSMKTLEEMFASSVSIDVPSAPYLWTSRTRTFTSAALLENDRFDGVDAQQPQVISLDDDGEESILTIPDDMSEVGRLNPQLRAAMEAHAQFTRQTQASPREQLESLLRESNKGKPVKITKTSLTRLRIDQLRSQLDAFGADSRGNKAALVKRLLDTLASSDATSNMTSVAQSLGEGLVSRKQLERAIRLKAREHLTADDLTLSESEVQSIQQESIESASRYNTIFNSPHEVAMILSEARADDISIIDVRSSCTFTDYMVIATGRSSQMVHILAEAILHEVKKRCSEVAPGVVPGIEGNDDANAEWLVVDSGSIVVHIFQENARKEFDLEGLWGTGDNITRVAPKKTIHTLDSIRI